MIETLAGIWHIVMFETLSEVWHAVMLLKTPADIWHVVTFETLVEILHGHFRVRGVPSPPLPPLPKHLCYVEVCQDAPRHSSTT